MEQKRRRRNDPGVLDASEVFRKLQESSYGGTKAGRRRNEIPAAPISDDTKGIKLRFSRASDKYPDTVELLMTDNTWVKYRIDIEQPAFSEVMKSLKEGDWTTGYPPEGS